LHILFLTQIVPYPPDAGPKVKTWHVLRYLVQHGHQVTLATFCREEEIYYLDTLRQLCSHVISIPIKRSRIADIGYWLKSHLTGRPFIIERDDMAAMRKAVYQVVAGGNIDVIHADQLGMAQFAFKPENSVSWPTTIFDAHNAVWTIVARTKESVISPLKPILALETERIRHHENKILIEFDHILAVSQLDKLALLATHPKDAHTDTLAAKISVIPIAVDIEELKPVKRSQGSKNILTMGTLHYPPNADGIRWFTTDVFPLIIEKMPDATLTIVGKNPPADFIQMAKDNPEKITVTGYVPDLTPYFEAASMLVVPVRAGGGIRVRILEAFARAMPVITTTVGLEGIEARPGIDVLVEDDVDSFANAALDLFTNQALQDQLARNGRKLAETRYDWKIILQDLDRVYDAIRAEIHP
jgi:glycosyltransferase involved in cell wall biosynthesis